MGRTGNPQQKKPSTGATIAKLAFGALFLATSFTSDGLSAGAFWVGIVFALALVAWAVIPLLQYKKAQKEAAQAGARQIREKLLEPRQCLNCGATTRGEVCEYCGSRLPAVR